MTTAVLQKTPVEAKWNLSRVQQETAGAFARQCYSTVTTLSKSNPEILKEFEAVVAAQRVAYFKTLGVKTPIDLVTVMGEFESNVFGSKIKIVGDDSKASLEYEACACLNAMEKQLGKVSEEHQKMMGQHFQTICTLMAKEFGFKAEFKFEEAPYVITFSK